jgi:hypothetical protein
LCRSNKEIFESIPDDKPVKMYFDADYVFYDGQFQDYNVQTANEVLRLNKLYLSSALLAKNGIEPQFAVAESHSRRRVKNDKEVWGYSFHITIPNIVCLKRDQKKFTEELNNAITEDQKYDTSEITKDRYTDYLYGLDNFKPFDTSVYNTGKQKFRTVYSSKSGEDRPFNIQEGTFNDMVISGFIADDVVHYVPVLTEKQIAVYEPKVIVRYDTNIEIKDDNDCNSLFQKLSVEADKRADMLFVKIVLDKGLLFSRSKDTEKWMATSMFLKGYFGNNSETVERFVEFSKLCANSFDAVDNMKRSNGFTTNEKYDNFGMFVNLCKEDDKVKFKEITNDIKLIQKKEKEEQKEINKVENERKKEMKKLKNEKIKELKQKSKEQMTELRNRAKESIEAQKEAKKAEKEELKDILLQQMVDEKIERRKN